MRIFSKATQIALLAFVLAVGAYFLQADARLDGADEGYYWYGVIHAKLGQIPIRDFEAYDPGRYYWGAAFSFLFGTGILAVRLAASLFQAACLFFGLSAAARVVKRRAALAGVGILSMAWMIYNFRYFDAGLPLLAVFFALRLVENPTRRGHFQAGIAAALAAFFGLNHGLYFLAVFCFLIFYCDRKRMIERPAKARVSFVLGILTGLLPFFAMWIFVPGFFEAYWGRFFSFGGFLLKGMANYQAKIPWPWTLSWGSVGSEQTVFWVRFLRFSSLWAQGAAFLTVILFYLLSVPALFKMNKEEISRNPLFLASVFTGIVYAHHIFARSDISHLGEGIFPVITGLFSVPGIVFKNRQKLWQAIFVTWISALTLLGAASLSGLFFKMFAPREAVVRYPIGKDKIWLLKNEAVFLDNVQKIVKENVPPNEKILFAPLLTTLYCVLDKESPAWEIYFFRPAPERLERKLIRQMEEKKVNWAMISESNPTDSRSEVQFCNSHLIVCEYLMKNFDAVPVSGLPEGYYFLKRAKER